MSLTQYYRLTKYHVCRNKHGHSHAAKGRHIHRHEHHHNHEHRHAHGHEAEHAQQHAHAHTGEHQHLHTKQLVNSGGWKRHNSAQRDKGGPGSKADMSAMFDDGQQRFMKPTVSE